MKKRLLNFIGLLVFSLALFIIGGWDLIIGAKTSLLTFLLDGNSGLIWTSDTFAIRFNEKYYGFINTHRFFNAPVISWFFLSVSLAAFYFLFKELLFGDYSEENVENENFDLTEEVKEIIKESWEKEGSSGIIIENLTLTHKKGNEYVGILETIEDNKPVFYNIKVNFDGQTISWKLT